MLVPGTALLAWTCFAAGVAAATTCVMLVVSRLRYERRHRLLRAVEDLLPAEPPDQGRLEGARVLSRAPLGDLFRLMRECHASRGATALIAESLNRRIGSARVLSAAGRRGARHSGRRIVALRIVSFAGRAERWRLLADASADGTPDVKAAAISLLGQLGDRQSAFILVSALRAGRYSRSSIAARLDALPVDVADVVAPLLDAPDPAVRFWGVRLIERYPQAAGIAERLVALTADADPLVRKAAIDAVGVIGAAAAVIAVRARVADEAAFVRAHAARALAHLGGAAESPALLPLLADGDWSVRDSAKQGLRAMGEAAAPAVLPWLTHGDPFARNSAAEVLQDIGTFDRLLVQEIEGPTDRDRVRTLHLLARAGGSAMAAAVVDRLRADARARASRLIAESDREHPPVKDIA
jgi:HEAT repeat protein